MAGFGPFGPGQKGGPARRRTERSLDEAFWAALSGSLPFRTWFMAQTKFAAVPAILRDEPWQFRWYRSLVTGVESETDIFLLFDRSDGGGRFALHIENKLKDGRFGPRQAELYAERARDWMTRHDYQDFEIVLIAPDAFRDRNAPGAALFDRFVSHAAIAGFIPEFAT